MLLPIPTEAALSNLSLPQPLPQASDRRHRLLPLTLFPSHLGLVHFHKNPGLLLGQNLAGIVPSQ